MKIQNLTLGISRKADGIPNKMIKADLPVIEKEKTNGIFHHLSRWFNHEAPENLTTTEAVCRGGAIITMPLLLSLFDSSFHTDVLPFIVPVMFYLEVTAFTMYCPIKAMFSDERQPAHYD